MASKNGLLLQDFALYCLDHPEERFWQALRNWSRINFIIAADSIAWNCGEPEGWTNERDTFYWEGKNGEKK
jgi:hypothetical protein